MVLTMAAGSMAMTTMEQSPGSGVDQVLQLIEKL
jgi:hypothetical protein